MKHNAFAQPFVEDVAPDVPAVRDRGRSGDDDVLRERHGVEQGVHRSGRARLIGSIGHDDQQVTSLSGRAFPRARDPNNTIHSGSNSSAMSATILVTIGP